MSNEQTCGVCGYTRATPSPAPSDMLARRRAALIERIGTIADLTASKPLEGELGDIAYDLLRQAAAQMSSDHKVLGGSHD